MFDLSLDGAVARLVLDRPEARNAVPKQQWARLAQTFEEAAAGGARVLILSGRGPAFCAGADLGDFPSMHGRPEAAAAFREAMADAFERIAALPMPTLAAIDGPCFGAGVALAMACDLRFAGPAARFAITPAKFGISYPQGDISRLVALVGPGQASRLLLGACPSGAREAERIGLVDIFAAGGAEAAAAAFAEAVLSNSDQSLRVLKRGIALATRGIAHDPEQDRSFDALLASDALADRLQALRGPR